jgi:Ca-activated chloride channel homolog
MTSPAWLSDVVTFAHPGWLVLLAGPPLLWLLRRVRPAAPPAVSSLTWFDAVPTTWRVRLRWLPGACRTIAFVLIAIALAGPERITPAREGVRPGLDVLLLIDVSQSMRAHDGTPDRLGSAIALSQALVKARPRDRIGVLLFAGDHAIACPLTVDHASVVDRLQAITVTESDEGTAIGVAITGALGRLQTARAARGAIVVVTDGASNTGNPLPEEGARLAARQGMSVMTVGVGRDGLVPFPTDLGVVEIPLGIDEPALRRVAAAGGGAFVRATDRQAVASVAASLDRIEPAERVVTSRTTAPMGAWLGAAAAIALLLELALSRLWLRNFL